MARRTLHIFLVLISGCLFMLHGGQEVHANTLSLSKSHILEQHSDFSCLNHEDKDKPQNLYCRLRTRGDVQQNQYLYADFTTTEIPRLPAQPEELVSVRIHTSNEYFRSFLKRLLFPKHSFW